MYPPTPKIIITKDNINDLYNLPINIIFQLYCEHNDLTTLPILKYKNVQVLDCNYNKLTTLPELPGSLYSLYCTNNEITALDDGNIFRSCNMLKIVNCSDNKLTSLPKLPSSLTFLYCDNNKLTSLQNLPEELFCLSCTDNKLKTLGILPKSIELLNLDVNYLETESFEYLSTFIDGKDDIFMTRNRELIDKVNSRKKHYSMQPLLALGPDNLNNKVLEKRRHYRTKNTKGLNPELIDIIGEYNSYKNIGETPIPNYIIPDKEPIYPQKQKNNWFNDWYNPRTFGGNHKNKNKTHKGKGRKGKKSRKY